MNELELSLRMKESVVGQQWGVLQDSIPFKILEQEYPICLDGKCCGLLDYIIKYNSRNYALEVKNMYGKAKTHTFWNATKVIAYCSLLNIVEGKGKGKDKYLPAVLIPKEVINIKIMTISILLNIKLFSFYFDEAQDKLTILDELLHPCLKGIIKEISNEQKEKTKKKSLK